MRRVMSALVAAAILGGPALVAPPAWAASASGNIPGVPLPASLVSGQLGGPIYDVVYSVDVPAAHVLRLSLSGTSGTDFDLYLFDSTATDIYAQPPVGLVASSIGPTSTESITYPTVAGGRFYIDLSGATDVEGTYFLSVEIAADTVPPTVSLSLDGGAPATNNPTVTATVIATDDLSGVGDVQFSVDGTSWSAWQPYAPTVSWTFAAGDGPKTLWVRARDRAGNVSLPVQATIELITTSPVIVARDPASPDAVTSTHPTIRVTFSEPIRLSSWMNFGLLLQDPSGALIYGTYGWDSATNTGSFTPSVPLVPGVSYVVSVGSVVDLAGNPLARAGSWVILPMILPAVSLRITPQMVGMGGTVALTGRVVGGVGAAAQIERSVGRGPWGLYVTVFPAPDGSFATGAQIDVNASFRVDVPATATSAEAVSPPVRVLVRRQVRLAGGSASVTRQLAAGTRVALTAVVGPPNPPVSVIFSIYRYVPGRGYTLQTSITRTTVGGRCTFAWHLGRGLYIVRLTTPPSSSYANGISPAYPWAGY
jgi:hypothetical protein